MGFAVAVAGKGGTGKTSISALVLRAMIKAGLGPVLLIDADPNSNLHSALGLEQPKTIGDLMERTMAQKEGLPAGMSKTEFISYGIEECLHEGNGFDLLSMGRPEGPGCYCFVNNVLREAIDKLGRKYPAMIVDNEAGFEHLSRRTMRRADRLLLIADCSVAALSAAGRASGLADELKLDVEQRGLILNRTRDVSPGVQRTVEGMGVALLGTVPPDEALAQAAVDGRSLLDLPDDSPAVRAVQEIAAGQRMLEAKRAPSR